MPSALYTQVTDAKRERQAKGPCKGAGGGAEKIQGGSDPVYPTDTPRLDITDANNGDKPPV
jgi:hypothetical protein